MLNYIKRWFASPDVDMRAEIAKLQHELAVIRSLADSADSELRDMITGMRIDMVLSIEEIRLKVAELERKQKLNHKSTTGKFILSYIMGEDDLPNPSEVLKH